MSSDTEKAWAAGLWDGEGCAFVNNNGSGKQYFRMTISQADPEVLERFRKAVGVKGNLNGPVNYANRNPMWFLNYSAWDDTTRVVDAIYPYLSSIKRKQIEEKRSEVDPPSSYGRHGRRLSQETVSQIIEMFKSGMSYEEIATEVARPKKAIYQIIYYRRTKGEL